MLEDVLKNDSAFENKVLVVDKDVFSSLALVTQLEVFGLESSVTYNSSSTLDLIRDRLS